MTSPKLRKDIWPATNADTTDGRRRRSNVAQQKIVSALFELLSEGNMSPEAVLVAKRANVGVRTVFRHFEDMDAIYHEMTDRILAGVMPSVTAPLRTKGWRNQLTEYSTRRIEIYEAVFPMRMCLGIRRHQSDYLMERFKLDMDIERASLRALLPEHVLEDEVLYLALEAALAFPNWRRLRSDVGLSVEDAKAVIGLTLTRLVGDVADTDG